MKKYNVDQLKQKLQEIDNISWKWGIYYNTKSLDDELKNEIERIGQEFEEIQKNLDNNALYFLKKYIINFGQNYMCSASYYHAYSMKINLLGNSMDYFYSSLTKG